MESYRLKSKVSVNDREFLVQTVNDAGQQSVVSSLFVDGKILEVNRYPHPPEVSPEEVLAIVRTRHDEKKNELEHLLATYAKVAKSGNVELLYHLGTAFYYKRMFDEADAIFTEVLKLSPDHHQAAGYHGLSLLALGRHEEAVKALARAVEKRPGFADYRNSYGEALLEAGFCRRAVEEFEGALKLNIYYADAYFNLGIAYIANAVKREDFDLYANLLEKTTDLFNRAVLIAPEYKTVQFDEAVEVLRQNDLPRALTLFKAVRDEKREIQRQRYSDFYCRFQLFADQADEKAMAERICRLQAEIDKNPTYVDLCYELALCYLQQAQLSWQKGIEQFAKTIAVNPQLTKAIDGKKRTEQFAASLKAAVTEIIKGGKEH
jgi:tetratricopeptide (TPR) repeat protein